MAYNALPLTGWPDFKNHELRGPDQMDEFYEGLAEILEVPAEQVKPEFSLADHDWDSMAIISCVALIDEVFGHLVSGSALAKCASVADIEKLITAAAQ